MFFSDAWKLKFDGFLQEAKKLVKTAKDSAEEILKGAKPKPSEDVEPSESPQTENYVFEAEHFRLVLPAANCKFMENKEGTFWVGGTTSPDRLYLSVFGESYVNAVGKLIIPICWGEAVIIKYNGRRYLLVGVEPGKIPKSYSCDFPYQTVRFQLIKS
jgi:hypothetical protein